MLELLTPSEFLIQYSKENLKDLNDNNKILLLMDRDLGLESERKGDDLLEDYLDNDCIYGAVFSEKFTIEDEIKEWKQDKPVYPLSKQRTQEKDKFIVGVRNVLWIRHIKKMQQDMNETFQKALANVLIQIKDLDPYAFDNAVMASSEKEGCWEYETLLRLYMIQLDTEIREIIKDKFDEVQQGILSLRKINNISQEDGVTSDYLMKLREDEMFIDGIYLNKTFAPIDNGDIFKIGDNEYILLAQPCNLALRKNGKRRTSIAYILRIDRESIADDNENNKDEKTFVEYLNFKDSTNKLFVKLSNAKPTCLSIFDLVSYNKDGLAKINFAEDGVTFDSILIYPKLQKRYEDLKKDFKAIFEVNKSLNTKDQKNSFRRILKYSCYMNPKIDGNTLSFDIQRVKRYRSQYAQVLLQQLNGYLSRAGFPHDFSEPVLANEP